MITGTENCHKVPEKMSNARPDQPAFRSGLKEVSSEGRRGSVYVGTCTATQLFEANRLLTNECNVQAIGTLTIPEYQRPYCWQEKQIAKLLDDIATHAGNSADLNYYLGCVILHQQGRQLNIIDGQQRITTLALLGHVGGQLTNLALRYESPLSQQQIKENLRWLKASGRLDELQRIDFDQLQFTRVITQSEDDAYQFFETQNTGGVRLSGPDIIKAHHLRAVDKIAVNDFAQQWESLGDLGPVIDVLLRGRYWQCLNFQDYPPHNQVLQVRACIVNELADQAVPGEDRAFARIIRIALPCGGEQLSFSKAGYDLRQPLNSGANTIHYLQYFEGLRQKYLTPKLPPVAQADTFYGFYSELVCKLEGCGYLKQLFDACLLLYIGQFGEQSLNIAAKKIFRVVYSCRVENRKAVREKSVPSFVRKTPVLDWIALSYTPEQCFALFDAFKLTVNPDGLGVQSNGVKKRFVKSVCERFDLKGVADDLSVDIDSLDIDANAFAQAFSRKVISL